MEEDEDEVVTSDDIDGDGNKGVLICGEIGGVSNSGSGNPNDELDTAKFDDFKIYLILSIFLFLKLLPIL